MATKPNSKSEKIRDYIRSHPEASNIEIAHALNAAHGHVWQVRQAMIKRMRKKVIIIKRAIKADPSLTIDATPEEDEAFDSLANKTQVAGNHYQSKAIQPWDFIASNNMGYLEGNIIKYVSRWKEKGGIEDLKKAQHYLQKLIEVNQ